MVCQLWTCQQWISNLVLLSWIFCCLRAAQQNSADGELPFQEGALRVLPGGSTNSVPHSSKKFSARRSIAVEFSICGGLIESMRKKGHLIRQMKCKYAMGKSRRCGLSMEMAGRNCALIALEGRWTCDQCRRIGEMAFKTCPQRCPLSSAAQS